MATSKSTSESRDQGEFGADGKLLRRSAKNGTAIGRRKTYLRRNRKRSVTPAPTCGIGGRRGRVWNW